MKIRAAKWPGKKNVVFQKGVMAAFLKANNKMKKQLKAGKTDWSDPESSDDEGAEGSDEISFDEKGFIGEAEPNKEIQSELNKEMQSEPALTPVLPPAGEKPTTPLTRL